MAKTRFFHGGDCLDTPEDVAAYLSDAMLDADPNTLTEAIKTVARARGWTSIAADTGLEREFLYQSFRAGGDVQFSTVIKVMGSLGVKITVEAA